MSSLLFLGWLNIVRTCFYEDKSDLGLNSTIEKRSRAEENRTIILVRRDLASKWAKKLKMV